MEDFCPICVNRLVGEMGQLNQLETPHPFRRLTRKLKENPFLGVGILGLVGVCAVGASRFNRRPQSMSTSMYLMQLKIIAQGSVVGSLLGGTAYTVLKKVPALQLLRRP